MVLGARRLGSIAIALTACGSRTALDSGPMVDDLPPPARAPDAGPALGLDGGPVVTLSREPGTVPWNLAVDEKNVYWTDERSGNVMRVPIGGGATTTLYVGGGNSPEDLAASGSGRVVVALDSALIVVPTSGGAVVTLSPSSSVWGVAADVSYAYWTEGGELTPGRVCRAPLTGGATSILADGVWTPGAITVDAEFAYWIAFTDTTRGYLRAPLTGGTTSTLATVSGADTPPDFLALGANSALYSTDSDTGTLLSVALAGGGASTLSSSLAGLASDGVASDGRWVYVGANDREGADVSLLAIPLASPSTPEVAWRGTDIYTVRADATNLYWTVPRGGAVLEMPKASILRR